MEALKHQVKAKVRQVTRGVFETEAHQGIEILKRQGSQGASKVELVKSDKTVHCGLV